MSFDDEGSGAVLVRYHTTGRSTVKARQFFLTDTDSQGIWVPRSQIKFLDADACELWVPLWLAEQDGLDYE